MAESKERRATLRSQISAKIAKYQYRNEKPPYSFAELVVMAILSHEEELVAKHKIYLWIMTTFKYYHDRALLEFATEAAYSRDYSIEYAMDEEVSLVWRDYNIPLSSDAKHQNTATTDSDWFSVPVNEARLFLRNVLTEPPKGTLPFFELPAELRIRVYEMVFSFPDIHFDYDSKIEKLSFCKREHNEEQNYPISEVACFIDGPPTARVLALLAVNKQLYNEALPCFYRLNRFKFHGPRPLANFVNRIGQDRLKNVRHISIHLERIFVLKANEFSMPLKQLVSFGKLRSLEIVATDKCWFDPRYTLNGGAYSNPADLPFMSKLAQLVGMLDEVTIYGNCPRIEEYLLKHKQNKGSVLNTAQSTNSIKN